jgi:hypothetical protein
MGLLKSNRSGGNLISVTSNGRARPRGRVKGSFMKRKTPSRGGTVSDLGNTTQGCNWACPDASGGYYYFTCDGPCPCSCFPLISTGTGTVGA